MPVVHVRMDNRLIHGQILVAWKAEFKIDHIIVTNDQVAADPMQVTLLRALAPIGPRVSVLSIKDCVAYCSGPESDNESIFIITKFPEDGLVLVEEGLDMTVLNLGNQAYVPESKKLCDTVYLTESGVKALKKLHESGICITCRMMPSDSDTDVWPLVERRLPQWAK